MFQNKRDFFVLSHTMYICIQYDYKLIGGKRITVAYSFAMVIGQRSTGLLHSSIN